MVEPVTDVDALIRQYEEDARVWDRHGQEHAAAYCRDTATALRTLQERCKKLEKQIHDLQAVDRRNQ